MSSTSKVLCALVLVGLLGQAVLGQGNRPDELKYRGSQDTSTPPSSNQQSSTSVVPSDESRRNEYEDGEQRQREPFSPNHNLIMPFDLSSFFGGRPQNNNRRPISIIDSMFGDSLFENLDRHARQFEKEFTNLERQAGEGQDVSYFNRNGVAYVRTCTTRRVSPDGQPQIDGQQQQQQQQPQPDNNRQQLDKSS